jgi:hypothetical protein
MAAAHGHIDRIDIDGKSYGGFNPGQSNVPDLVAWSTADTQDAYVQTFDYNQPNIICHEDAQPGALAGEVAAGGNVTLHWSRWFEDHRGPVSDQSNRETKILSPVRTLTQRRSLATLRIAVGAALL